MPRNLARSLAALTGILLGLLATEGLARARFGYDGRAAAVELAEIESATLEAVPRALRDGARPPGTLSADQRALHPYLGFAPEEGPRIVSDELERFLALPDDVLRVLVLGGSVAAIFEHLGLPLLVDLPPLAGRRVAVFNGAAGGYKQPQQVVQLVYLLSLGAAPDLVLNLDGFNEVALGRANLERGFHPVQPSAMHWLPVVPDAGGTRALRDVAELWTLRERLLERVRAAHGPGLRSAVLGRPRLFAVRRAQAAYRRRAVEVADAMGATGVGTHLAGPRFPPEPEPAMALTVEAWAAGSRALAALSAGCGAAYVHVLQPTLHDPGAKPVTDDERASGGAPDAWLAGVLDGYPLLREAGAELAREGIAFVDLSRVFADVDRTLYYDNCHFGAEGNALLARALSDFLVAALDDGRLDF